MWGLKLPDKNKKHTDPNRPSVASRPQSRTLHNTTSSHTLAKKGFKFRWWYAAILVLVIAVIGIAVLRFSRASNGIVINCDQYRILCSPADQIVNNGTNYVAYRTMLDANLNRPVSMSESATNIFGPNNGRTDSVVANVCWTIVALPSDIRGGINYTLSISTQSGSIQPITDTIYAPGTITKCANNVWIIEPQDNNSPVSYGLNVNGDYHNLYLAQVSRTTVSSPTGVTAPPPSSPPVPVITKPSFGGDQKAAMDAAIRIGGNIQGIEATCNAYENKDECESYFREAIKPIGNVESFDCKEESTLNGWAADPTAMNDSIRVDIYIDNQPSGFSTTANKPRPDTGGNHGFNAVVPTQYLNGQTHTARAYGIGRFGNRQIGGDFQFKCEQPPIGNVESIVSNNTFNATINGWTFDKSNSNVSLEVHVYYDGPAGQGSGGGVFKADKPRPDVNRAFGVGGNHGFTIPIAPQKLDGKQHSVYLYAIGINPNGSPSGYNTNLTEKKFGLFNINATPRGTVDALNCRSDNKNVATGWAFDPNDANKSIDVDMYIDGKGAGRFRADQSRPDVNAAFGINGNHGFNIPIPQSAQDGKQHTIQIYAIGLGINNPSQLPQFNPLISPKSNTNFACNRLPEGNLEDTVFSPSPNYQCIARGWAYDPSAPDLPAQVAMYIDFNSDFSKWASLETITAKNSRGDLLAAKKGNGNHGFVYAIPSKFYDGKPHTIFAYALNMDNAGKYLAFDNRFIGNKTFTCQPKSAGTVTVNQSADTKTTNIQTQSSVTDATNKNDNKQVTVINTKAPINYDQTQAAEDLKSATKDIKKIGNPQVIPATLPSSVTLATNDAENKNTASGVVFIHPTLPKSSGINQTAIYIDGKNPTIYKSDDVTQELDTRLLENGDHKIQTLAYANDNNIYAVEQTIKVDNKPTNPLFKLWLRIVYFVQGKNQ
jgi:hypothetical protein